MTDDEYKTWATHHATLFMMTGESDLALFSAWKPLAKHYDFQEFVEGSNYIATEKPGIFRTSHLSLICQHIKSNRAAKARQQEEEEQQRGFERAARQAVIGKISLVDIFKSKFGDS